ncbi:hypothetical protein ABIB94_007512 [Bradyrhizobium sp. JR7.2]
MRKGIPAARAMRMASWGPFSAVRRPKERQIGSLIERGAKVVRWQSVLDRGDPIRLRQRQTLMVRYRHEAPAGKLPQHLGKARQVEPAMHGGYEGHAEPTEQRKGQPVDVSVDLDLGARARHRAVTAADQAEPVLSGAAGRSLGPPETGQGERSRAPSEEATRSRGAQDQGEREKAQRASAHEWPQAKPGGGLMKIEQPEIRRLIADWFQKNALCESWLMHLKHHDVPPPQAIEAMERFV